MKKITYSLLFFAAVAMLLSSCARLSTMSVTKRHYRDGYYIDMGNAKHKTETTASQKIKTPVAETVPAVETTDVNNLSETTPVKINTAATGTSADKKNVQDVSKDVTASTHKHSASSNLKHIITPNTIKELENIKTISNSIQRHGSNDGLIWTIIVILLLLWLLSVLTGGWGLGGLIYLLLAIAIILIILKLLGVI